MNAGRDAERDAEAEFISGLLDLGYGKGSKNKLKEISSQVSWARGWPEDKKAFWNAEAFLWGYKIEKEVRGLISSELSFLSGGKNLDLGCGAYSYLPSVGLDLSRKMLQFNDQCREKVLADLEKALPFDFHKFDSVTAVFLLNYVCNYLPLLAEIRRVLRPEGIFVAVLSAGKVNEWQRQKEANSFSAREWQEVLESSGFRVQFYEKERICFFKCTYPQR